MEGLQLLAVYVVLVIAFYLMPPVQHQRHSYWNHG